MAAVLCKSIGECIFLPCKLCATCCNGCGAVCNGACKGCDSLCRLLCRNPFSLFVTVTLLTQGPSIFLVIPGIGGIPDCTESLYLVANSILAVVNVGTAFYLAYKIVDTSNQEMAHLDTAFKRATYLLCNDCWMAVYICLFIGFVCVQSWGSSVSFQNFWDDDTPAEDQICPESVKSMVQIGTALGWTFCFLGFYTLVFSMCCAKFDNADYSQPANTNTNNGASVPHGSYDANNNGSAAHNAQGVPNNDFFQPQGGKTNGKASANTASNTATPMYAQNGTPANNFPHGGPHQAQARPPQQQEIPMAYAETIPASSQASAPPSQYDDRSNAGRGAAQSGDDNNKANTAGGKVGGTAGKQIGKLFSKDQAKQEKIAQQGQKAGEAVGSGVSMAMKFVQSKMKKDDKKK